MQSHRLRRRPNFEPNIGSTSNWLLTPSPLSTTNIVVLIFFLRFQKIAMIGNGMCAQTSRFGVKLNKYE